LGTPFQGTRKGIGTVTESSRGGPQGVALGGGCLFLSGDLPAKKVTKEKGGKTQKKKKVG